MSERLIIFLCKLLGGALLLSVMIAVTRGAYTYFAFGGLNGQIEVTIAYIVAYIIAMITFVALGYHLFFTLGNTKRK